LLVCYVLSRSGKTEAGRTLDNLLLAVYFLCWKTYLSNVWVHYHS